MAPWDHDNFTYDKPGFFYEYINPLARTEDGLILVASPCDIDWLLDRMEEVEEHVRRLTEFQREHIVIPAAGDVMRCIHGEFRVAPPPEDIEPLRGLPEANYRFVAPDGQFHQRVSQMVFEPPVYRTFGEWWEEVRSFLTPLRDSHVIVPTVLSAA